MEAVHTSEMSVNFNVTTWCYIPEDSKLHTCCHENLKSFMLSVSLPFEISMPIDSFASYGTQCLLLALIGFVVSTTGLHPACSTSACLHAFFFKAGHCAASHLPYLGGLK
jgi:hypothetical protein